jgi:arginyl-tRNA synthetase
MNIHKTISNNIKSKLRDVPDIGAASVADILDNIVIEVPKVRDFGDFSTNIAMVLAKPLGKSPRDIANMLIPHINDIPEIKEVSIAGPGFINIKLKDEFIIKAGLAPLDISAQAAPLKIDLDYGSYNVAKSLHIGHLRGGIIGDTFYRMAKFLGHKPVSYNHIGDWGRPMALVIAWIMKKFPNDWNKPDFKIDESEFNDYYPAASAYSKENPEFLEQVLLIKKEFQDGRADYFALYEKMLKISLDQMSNVVRRLNMLPFDNTLGERNAAKYLGPVEEILRAKNLIEKDDGAEIIKLRRDEDNAPMPPYMWRDSRGADTYDSTDLAAMYYRKITDNPDKIIYFSDYRQKLHFAQLFRAAEISGVFPADKLEFPYFGGINGADGKPYKTRDGNVAGLLDIVQMVGDAARARVLEAGKNLPDETIEMIALAALKFNDLIHDMKSDYIFDADEVTNFEGRTGPYVLYTAVRLNSIIKKVNPDSIHHDGGAQIVSLHPDERGLLLMAADFERIVNVAFDRRAPDVLANYAYDLCQSINTFYHSCPILRDDLSPAVRAHRFAIVEKSIEVLSRAIGLMGLNVPDKM